MKRHFYFLVLGLVVVTTLWWCGGCRRSAGRVTVSSKTFTESVILGELATQSMRANGVASEHRRELNGTRVLWEALLAGQIDVYPDYTGTLTHEILHRPDLTAVADIRAALAAHGIGMTEPLGFNDTYAIGMRPETAERLNIRSISDLSKHPQLKFAFTNEFIDRQDGWPTLRTRYGLPQQSVTGLDHDLAYRALADGSIDATDLYSTDAEIVQYGLRVLEDDRSVFPAYEAVYLYRLDLADRSPQTVASLERLAGRIDEATMIRLNARAKLQKVPEGQVASDFLAESLGLQTDAAVSSGLRQLLVRTGEHLFLVTTSLAAAIGVGLAAGVFAGRRPRVGTVVVGFVAAIYTIPSLALLVFMIPLLGIGSGPAIVALFLYSLLPIVRNTATGLTSIDPALRESAEALGLSRRDRLWRVELPLASPAILAGIKTAAVLNVGTATLGGFIGAGGYGQTIFTGIRLADTKLILLGAVPAAVMALAAQGLFALLGRWVVPRGLRLREA